MKWIEALQKVIGGTAPAQAAPRQAPAMKFCGRVRGGIETRQEILYQLWNSNIKGSEAI
jgi:hypothetical protein